MKTTLPIAILAISLLVILNLPSVVQGSSNAPLLPNSSATNQMSAQVTTVSTLQEQQEAPAVSLAASRVLPDTEGVYGQLAESTPPLESAYGRYQSFILHTSTILHETGLDNGWSFIIGDYNRDNKPDLYAIKKINTVSNKTEVHVLNGVNKFQSFLLQTGTALHQTGADNKWSFVLGDYNKDGKQDLYAIAKADTGSNTTEVHILNGADTFQSFLLHTRTALHQTGTDNGWVFTLGDYNNDGKMDLYAIAKTNTGSGRTEVHVLNGANKFQSFLLQTATILHSTGSDSAWDFVLGDYNHDGKQDLYAIKKAASDTGRTEVHVLNGANRFQSFLFQSKTALHETGNNYSWAFGLGDYDGDGVQDLYTIKKAYAESNTTEVHVLSGRYQLPPPVSPPSSPPSNSCSVPFFWQQNPQWRHHPLRTIPTMENKCSKYCSTIGTCGCTLTSVAMVFKYYGANLTPPELSDCMMDRACPFYWYESIGCSQGKVTGPELYRNYKNFSSTEEFWRLLDQKVNQERLPVILGMEHKSKGTHWVVVVKGSGSNATNYTINDPAFEGGADMRLNAYLLHNDDLLNNDNTWKPTDIVVYSGQSICSMASAAAGSDNIDYQVPFDTEVNFDMQGATIAGTVSVYQMTSLTMTLKLAAQSSAGSVNEMLIWSDLVPNTTWQPFNRYVEVPVSDWVYVKFRDQLGNVSETASYTIIPPAIPVKERESVFLPLVIR